MFSLLVVSILATGGFEAGGQIGILWPASGLENNHAPTALFGVNLGCETGPGRVTLDYDYAGLRAKQAGPYRFDIHELLLGYDYEFFRRQTASGTATSWGFDASAAAGYSLLSRTLDSAREIGRTPAGRVAIGFFQRQGRCRLSLGLVHTLYFEKDRNGSSGLAVGQLLSLRAGVTAAMAGHPRKTVREKPIPQPPTPAPETPPEIAGQPEVKLDLVTIHFDFDKWSIRPGDAGTLEGNARQLLDAVERNVKPTVMIEGYCDPIGTSEYNLALGQRRAESAKAYLVKLGVAADQLSTTSYGEEKLVTTDETRYEMNRRCEFKTR
jgi:peptidoglycan-associated lipoprotein